MQISKHGWFSGRILACHAGGPGSIPGPCIYFNDRRTHFMRALTNREKNNTNKIQLLQHCFPAKIKRSQTSNIQIRDILWDGSYKKPTEKIGFVYFFSNINEYVKFGAI